MKPSPIFLSPNAIVRKLCQTNIESGSFMVGIPGYIVIKKTTMNIFRDRPWGFNAKVRYNPGTGAKIYLDKVN